MKGHPYYYFSYGAAVSEVAVDTAPPARSGCCCAADPRAGLRQTRLIRRSMSAKSRAPMWQGLGWFVCAETCIGMAMAGPCAATVPRFTRSPAAATCPWMTTRPAGRQSGIRSRPSFRSKRHRRAAAAARHFDLDRREGRVKGPSGTSHYPAGSPRRADGPLTACWGEIRAACADQRRSTWTAGRRVRTRSTTPAPPAAPLKASRLAFQPPSSIFDAVRRHGSIREAARPTQTWRPRRSTGRFLKLEQDIGLPLVSSDCRAVCD